MNPAADGLRTVAVIPAHDEERTIARVVTETLQHVDAVLVVDDGSSDATGDVAEQAGARVFRLRPNRGKGGALAFGLDQALALGAERLVTLDADGEHEPSDIPALLGALDSADVVLGHRHVYRSGARQAMNRLALFWFQLLDPAIQDTICGFRAFRAKAIPVVQNSAGGFAYEHEVILRAVKAGLRLATVPIRTEPRAGSHVTTRHIIHANNHFDRFILREIKEFQLPTWRKGLLAAGAVAGLALGETALLLMRPRTAR